MHPRRPAQPRRLASGLVALLTAALLAGCASPVRLMPTPVSFRSGDVDPFAHSGTTLLGTDVPVLHATNRGAIIEKPEPIHAILPSIACTMRSRPAGVNGAFL